MPTARETPEAEVMGLKWAEQRIRNSASAVLRRGSRP
jgi:hypothetical protein